MAAKNSGIREDLDRLFPGCKVVDGWGLDVDAEAEGNDYSPRNLLVLEYIRGWFEKPGLESLTYDGIAKQLGMKRSNVSRAVSKVEPALNNSGIKVERSKGRYPSPVVRDPNFVESQNPF